MESKFERFLKSKSAVVLFWMIALLFEYFFLRRILNIIIVPQNIIYSITLVATAFLLYCIYYWIYEKTSTEGFIYSLLLLDFMVLGFDKEVRFEEVFHIPYHYLPRIILVYIMVRMVFPFRLIKNIISDLIRALIKVRSEKAKEREALFESIQEERDRRLKEKKERDTINSKHRQNRWKNFGSSILRWRSNFVQSIKDAFVGLGESSNIQPATTTTPEEHERIRFLNSLHRKTLAWMVFVFILLAVAIYFILQITGTDLTVLFKDNPSVEDVITRFTNITIRLLLLFIVVVGLMAIIANLIIQVVGFIADLHKDLVEKDKQKRTITGSVIFTLTSLLIIRWIAQEHPISVDSLAQNISSGELVVYPIGFLLLVVIMSFFTNTIKQEDVTSYLQSQEVNKIGLAIVELAIGSIRAIVLYLKVVTSDFLSSVIDLSFDDNNIDDLEGDLKEGEK